MDFSQLAQAASATPANAIKYAEPLSKAFDKYGLTTQQEKAMLVAQCAIESDHLASVEESLYYKDAARMASMYPSMFKSAAEAAPYTRNHAKMSQARYQGFHGRGLIQLTWMANYLAYSKYTGIDYVANPDWLMRPDDAADSACWYFTVKTDCRTPANRGDVTAVTRLINPKLMKLAERQAQFPIAMKVAL